MIGQRFDYSGERQRHEKFVDRAELLARLDQLLLDGDGDRWVVVTGGPGMGKSATLAAWLARCEAAGATVPHHFIHRDQYDGDDPGQLVGSLVAELKERFAPRREPEADARMHPAARRASMLSRVSERELVPRGEREHTPVSSSRACSPTAWPTAAASEWRPSPMPLPKLTSGPANGVERFVKSDPRRRGLMDALSRHIRPGRFV